MHQHIDQPEQTTEVKSEQVPEEVESSQPEDAAEPSPLATVSPEQTPTATL
ncbi:hypothetical protein FHS15_003307 [Paenibacillus castaneae]|uniref:hypothetical protein n=1 Tax=Paenibacillus castaneae TaxID=474957 RepID=UPI00141B2E9D|nr:hypothetical protein [Paenibacillus castaneae]NIK78169.1 hypothetical protein [Paenibacillus castaneae]